MNVSCPTVGAMMACYTGASGTENVGVCKGGTMTCQSDNTWSSCNGEVVPTNEPCNATQDLDCDGKVGEDVDEDGDGWTSCGGDCCDDPNVCSNPAGVNPGAFEVAGDGVDNDCDGKIDEDEGPCDTGLLSNTTNMLDYVKALDLCNQGSAATSPAGSNVAKTATGPTWGVISAAFSFADGTGSGDANGRSIRPHFGTGTTPQVGASLVELATGHAAAKDDTADPSYQDFQTSTGNGGTSEFPQDWYTANGSKLPNAPGCPTPGGDTANSPEMLTLTIRVPTNAASFTLKVNFFSSEFPEYVCTEFNDFFVVLLDSSYTGSGSAANPPDKNLAFYSNNGMKYPVGVNLADLNSGLFSQCVNGELGCAGLSGLTGSAQITTCTSTAGLAGTGMDTADPDDCNSNSLEGGGTGWLTTSGNVVPGEIITLRIAIWNTSDDNYQSIATVDGLTWSAEPSNPGTTILIARPNGHVDSYPVSQLDMR
jgi:hypothetical protein